MQSKTTKSGNGVKRRQFLQATGASALAVGVWSEVSAQESKSPNEKLNVLCVGTANRASANIRGVGSQEIVGLCDVDQIYLEYHSEQDRREIDTLLVETHVLAGASAKAVHRGTNHYLNKALLEAYPDLNVLKIART